MKFVLENETERHRIMFLSSSKSLSVHVEYRLYFPFKIGFTLLLVNTIIHGDERKYTEKP